MTTNSGSHKKSFDSDQQRLGTVYAKGLLAAAEKHQVVDPVLSQFDSLVDDVLEKLPKFELFLVSPRVAEEVKISILHRALADKASPIFLNFLKVIAEHGRLDCLREMRDAYRELYNELHGLVEVEVRTAGEVDSQLLGQIKQQLSVTLNRQVEVTSRVHPELLGGMVVRVGDTLFDGSVQSQLEQMRSDAMERTSELVRDSLERFMVTE